MQNIKQVLAQAPADHDNILLWAACCLTFFGFLRCSEFVVPSQAEYDPSTHFSLSDIAIDSTISPSMVQVTIKQSKTDPFRKGVTLSLAKTDKEICPVLAILPYLALRGSRPGPLFITEDQSFLTRPRFAEHLQDTLRQAGIDDKNFATHSFRSGAATGRGWHFRCPHKDAEQMEK